MYALEMIDGWMHIFRAHEMIAFCTPLANKPQLAETVPRINASIATGGSRW
jgi:hypothetical protein